MVGRDGQVRVMDFGLARQMPTSPASRSTARAPPRGPKRGDMEVGTGTLPLEHRRSPVAQRDAGAQPGPSESGDMQSSVSGLFDARLTRTGAMMGTPAYMAPEQFFGKETDARTDQFSFCVALYEALYGERPFPGKKLTELTANVVQGTIRDAPAGTKVPFWVRRILLRGLRSAPAERYPSMAEMLEALGKDPRAARRKWAVGAAVALLPVAVGLGVRQSLIDQAGSVRRRRRKAGGHLGAAPARPTRGAAAVTDSRRVHAHGKELRRRRLRDGDPRAHQLRAELGQHVQADLRGDADPPRAVRRRARPADVVPARSASTDSTRSPTSSPTPLARSSRTPSPRRTRWRRSIAAPTCRRCLSTCES